MQGNSTVLQLLSLNHSSVPNITIAGKYNCIQMAGNVSAAYNPVPKLGIYNTTFVIANCTRYDIVVPNVADILGEQRHVAGRELKGGGS